MKIPFNEVIQLPVAHQINNVPEVIFKMAKKNVENYSKLVLSTCMLITERN